MRRNPRVADDLDRKPILTTPGAAGAPIGEYPILIVGASDANYEITLENGVMRIMKTSVLLPIAAL